ncbi:acyl-CoA dehydrogenase family protein [Alicyclobacillus sendaiensis]|uniref:Acyl-CoA dehydrogenase family protein n=1 Tax=Alicyclobacillus sendaiensis PA2 TaxID=3029425 RepID=A0ABT6XZZ7_ALISE|nr:acyl-CoA dehydrogenase family protein [Alicyclobacillus sendaiensis]MDI9260653.1 acyl-CoA dehydrogenase family protein [Alicyclobacillus sendaiensis PA2]
MDFSFTEEQTQWREVVRDFARRELAPQYTYWDRTGVFPRELWRAMGRLGLTGLRVSEAYGGSGADCVTTGIAAEEIARADFNAAYAVMLNALLAEVMESHATEAVKASWLAPMAAGERLIAIAVTEPGAGSDVAQIATRAERKENAYVLTGEKSGISLAAVADAFVVFAKTDPQAGARGVSAFLVPRDAPGVEVHKYQDMGHVAVGRGSVFLDHVEVPEDYRIGDEHRAFYQLMKGFDFSRVLICLQCLGAAMQSLEETADHVKRRRAFGRPLAQFQGVAFPLVEYHTWVEMIRWFSYRALWLRDRGLPHTKEASMCKWLGPQIAVQAIHECILLHGHYGYTKDLPLEQRLRDVIGLEIGDGTAQTQKMVIAREWLGKEYKPY